MVRLSQFLVISCMAFALTACGGGGTSGDISQAIAEVEATIDNVLPGPRVGSEFLTGNCIESTTSIGSRSTTTIVNSCDQDINVRPVSSEFGPVFLVRANSTLVLNDLHYNLAACFAPKIPGGVADIFQYQCL